MGPFKSGWTEVDVEDVVRRGDPSELLYVPIVVGMNAAECEQSWAEAICLKLTDHPDFNVRGNALLGLGHIARVCGGLLSDRAIPAIATGLKDANAYVRDQAESAACDLEMFLHVSVPGYSGELPDRLWGAIRQAGKKR
jgi:hypothetical protein